LGTPYPVNLTLFKKLKKREEEEAKAKKAEEENVKS
jgi:hypothetical protein